MTASDLARPLFIAWAIFLWTIAMGCGAIAQQSGLIEADAAENMFYIKPDFDGSSVVLFGAVDRAKLKGEAFDIAITVRGPISGAAVWKKEPIGGVWINSRKLFFDAVPSVYAVLATKPVADLAATDERTKYELGLDTVRIVSGEALNEGEANEAAFGFKAALLKSKTASGLFTENGRGVDLIGRSLFRAKFFLPPSGGPGLYRIKVFLLQNGKVIGSTISFVRIEKAGLERLLSAASSDQPWLYGIVSVLVAVLVGSVASFIFRRS